MSGQTPLSPMALLRLKLKSLSLLPSPPFSSSSSAPGTRAEGLKGGTGGLRSRLRALKSELFAYKDKAGFSIESAFIFSQLQCKIWERLHNGQVSAIFMWSFLPTFALFPFCPFFTCSANFPSNSHLLTRFARPSSFLFSFLQFKLSPLLLCLLFSLSVLLVSSSCDITGHCSLRGLDTWPRCQATTVKGLSVSVCVRYACVCVCLCLFIAT